jgi:hypothetical protein
MDKNRAVPPVAKRRAADGADRRRLQYQAGGFAVKLAELLQGAILALGQKLHAHRGSHLQRRAAGLFSLRASSTVRSYQRLRRPAGPSGEQSTKKNEPSSETTSGSPPVRSISARARSFSGEEASCAATSAQLIAGVGEHCSKALFQNINQALFADPLMPTASLPRAWKILANPLGAKWNLLCGGLECQRSLQNSAW